MAGSISVSTTSLGSKINRYSVAWTSDASGNVNSNTFTMALGSITLVEFIPGSGGSQPSDLYDVDLEDADNIPIFDDGGGTSIGANLSNALGSHRVPLIGNAAVPTLFRRWHHGGDVELLVANAGNAKSGTVNIFLHEGIL